MQFYHKGITTPTQGGVAWGGGDREKEGIKREWARGGGGWELGRVIYSEGGGEVGMNGGGGGDREGG